jgi:hypothetical protein
VFRKYSIATALTVSMLGNRLWHDRRVIALLDVARQVLAEMLRFAIVAVRPTRVAAEKLFLRRQLAMYVERGVKPGRSDFATRLTVFLLSSSSTGALR